MSSRGSTLTPVDDYLTGLSRALPGPRRRKADLLAEARDHLVDATEAFEADGLDRDNAEREAVADFGELDEVAPGYRAELAVSQGRRTAVMLCLVLCAQPLVWKEGLWGWNQDVVEPNPVGTFLGQIVEVVGGLAMAGAFLAVIAAGIGMRYPVVRDRVSRMTAVFALVSSVLVSLIGTGMGITSSHPNQVADFGAVGGFVVLPLLVVAISAGRCLRLARA
ncbi:permease prefix domain 1-containing protein [Kribbella sp. NPDC049174]|uniref:permease prefix domain 1-containing protein n=1 Tax=Kribbella sp. NPDC049174 TaxID=3364112 RepID=UPI00371BD60D